MTDGRGRVRVRAAQAEGLGKEPERLEAGCQFRGPAGSLVVRAWSKLGNEIPQERKKKKKKDSEMKRQKTIPRSELLEALEGMV